jgi:hypothetical protein
MVRIGCTSFKARRSVDLPARATATFRYKIQNAWEKTRAEAPLGSATQIKGFES